MSANPKVKELKPSSTLVLPTEKNQPKNKVSDYRWLIYGPPGIGKTTFANSFEMPLILDFEGGTNHLESYRIPISTWKDVEDVYTLLNETDHKFKTIVFDTVDLFYRLCQSKICTDRKIEHPSDEPYGKGSDMIRNKLLPCVVTFQNLGLGIVFISHEAQKEVKKHNMSFTKTTCTLPNSASNIFMPLADIIGYCHLDSETQQKRMITFQGSDYLDAKARTSPQVQLPALCELNFEAVKNYFEGEKTDGN